MRRSAVLLLLAVLTACLAASALAAGGGRTTSVVVYQPFTSGGELKASVKISETLSGSCFAGSLVSPRNDAWRCMVADDLYDPCFGNPSGTGAYVVCPEFGNAPRVVDRINLTQKLPAEGNTGEPGSTKGFPWLVLARPYAGYCDRLTGASSTVQGKRVNYECGRGGSLVGKIDRSSSRWAAKLITEGDNPTLYTVRIVIAWF